MPRSSSSFRPITSKLLTMSTSSDVSNSNFETSSPVISTEAGLCIFYKLALPRSYFFCVERKIKMTPGHEIRYGAFLIY